MLGQILDPDLIYDDGEDYFSNIDYTQDTTFAPPPLKYYWEQEPNVLQETPLLDVTTSAHQSDLFLGHILQALVATALVVISAGICGLLPGHAGGALLPIYVPEHFGRRNSQHPFDPYSFVHFGHGILSYYVFRVLDGEEPPDVFEDPYKTSLNHKGPYRDHQGGQEGLRITGITAALFAALAFEIMENSPLLIALFRQNSGPSELYRGDSTINVIGDLLACAAGYSLSRYLNVNLGLGHVPLLLYFLTEFTLAMTIRDNLALIALQLFWPSDWIKKWQEEVLPFRTVSGQRPIGGYWASKYILKEY